MLRGGALRVTRCVRAAHAPAARCSLAPPPLLRAARCGTAPVPLSFHVAPPPPPASPSPLLLPPPATLLRAVSTPRRRALLHTARAALADAPDASATQPPLAPWGVGFSAAGLLFPYYVGVAEVLRDEGVLTGARAPRRAPQPSQP